MKGKARDENKSETAEEEAQGGCEKSDVKRCTSTLSHIREGQVSIGVEAMLRELLTTNHGGFVLR